MIASQLISEDIPTLQSSDTALKALQWMDEYKVKHLPVVKKNEYLGLISENEILDIENPEISLGKIKRDLMKLYVQDFQHAYDVLKLANEYQLSAIPVLTPDGKYLGVISGNKLVTAITAITGANETGSIIVLELNINDYTLSEIARIVEGNDAKILSLYVTNHADSTKLDITLKVNRSNINGILQTFYRYNYVVSASYQETKFYNQLQNRYDELMKYLNI
jgi:acetoin utilization protein AcuB